VRRGRRRDRCRYGCGAAWPLSRFDWLTGACQSTRQCKRTILRRCLPLCTDPERVSASRPRLLRAAQPRDRASGRRPAAAAYRRHRRGTVPPGIRGGDHNEDLQWLGVSWQQPAAWSDCDRNNCWTPLQAGWKGLIVARSRRLNSRRSAILENNPCFWVRFICPKTRRNWLRLPIVRFRPGSSCPQQPP
jgi:hypothetical protein